MNRQSKAIVISEPSKNVGLLIGQILKSISIHDYLVTPDSGEAMEFISAGRAMLLVIDDTPERPAPLVMRHLISNPLTALTPTMILVNQNHREDRDYIVNMGRPMIIYKPLSPGRFTPAHKSLMSVWSKGMFADIQRASILLAEGRKEEVMPILTELSALPKALPVIAPSLSQLFRISGDVKSAEKLLLQAFKASPNDTGLVLALSELYLRTAMPNTALRLINSIERAHGESVVFIVDKLQANLLLGKIEDAIELIQRIIAKNLFPGISQEFLCRCLYSQGRFDEFKEVVKDQNRLSAFNKLWSGNMKQPSAAAS